MGVLDNISATAFPKQGAHLNARVGVCFHYDTDVLIGGRIVRDDAEAPWRTIIALDDGRYVLATECQYSLQHVTSEELRARSPKVRYSQSPIEP